MKGLIITNAYTADQNQLNQPLRLKEELEKKGVETIIAPLSVSTCGIVKDGISFNLGKYDFCVFYDKDKHALMQIEKTGLKCFNNYEAMTLCDDKMLTYIALSGNGITLPETYSSPLCYTKNARVKTEFIDFIAKKIGFPLIVKENFGSLGKSVHLVKNYEELENISSALIYKPHMYQQFIAESSGTDLRVIVIGGKYAGAMKRTSNGDFRSNVAAGGKGEPFNADEKTIRLAEKAAQILKLDYCGIDFLFGKNGPVLCEVNSNAFFKEFERVTGINVAELYAKHILNQIK